MVKTERLRGRSTSGEEMELDTWKVFSSADLLNSLVVERMLAGVAARRHIDVAEPVGEDLEGRSKSMSKSAVSRRFVAATIKAMGELMARNLSDLEVAVLMIDGLDVAGSCVVVALVLTTHGTKVPVGLWLGDTENKTVVTGLLADLVARGSTPSQGCSASSTGPRPSPRASRRSSAMPPRSRGAFCIMPRSELCRLGNERPGGRSLIPRWA